MSNSFTFPNPTVPKAQKNEEYHKKFVLAICANSFNSAYGTEYNMIETCQRYYNGTQSNDAYKFMQESIDGDSLPALWINYNKIKPKIDLMQGEFIKRKHRLNVSSVNPEAKSRKLEKKQDALTDLRLKSLVRPIEENTGLPLMAEPAQETDQEIEEFYNYTYKEKSEIVMRHALQYSLRQSKWDLQREALFRDLIITGRCFAKVELIDGIPHNRRIDPKFVVFDRNVTNDYLTDATFWGEIRYMSLSDAAQYYNVKQEDLQKLHNQTVASNILNYPQLRSVSTLMNRADVSLFKQENGELRVLVVEAYWEDYENLTYKTSEDAYGNLHYKLLSDDTKPNKNITAKRYKIWRKGVLLGGDLLVQFGKVENQPRMSNNITDTHPPYYGCIINYLNFSNQSPVSLIMPLQDLKNMALFNLQLSMARAGTKGFVYDVSQVPDGWDVHTVMKYLKTAGIAFINSKQDDGLPSTFNQFQQIDLSLSNEVEKYLNISAFVDSEMNGITGVNEARQGIVQNSSQAVGVTQSALLQSALSSEIYFNAISRLSTFIFNFDAALIKIAWPQYADRFSPIIGESGINFLNEDVDLSLDDYAVTAEDIPVDATDRQSLTMIVQAAMQNQQIDMVQALELLTEPNVDKAIEMFRNYRDKMKREAQKAEQAKMEAEQQAQMQAQQAQAQQAQQAQIQGAQFDMAKSSAASDNKIKEIAAQGQVQALLNQAKPTK
jgi:hypothetical protein